jgi:hypothetical protein
VAHWWASRPNWHRLVLYPGKSNISCVVNLFLFMMSIIFFLISLLGTRFKARNCLSEPGPQEIFV